MRVLVVNTNRYRNPVPVMPYGACIAAEAAEGAGHTVGFLDLAFCRGPVATLRRRLRKFQPDAVGFSIRNIDNNDMTSPQFFCSDVAELVQTVRQTSSARIILGGAGVSIMPGQILQATGADFAVTGEGEVGFPALLNALEAGGDVGELPSVYELKDGQIHGNTAETESETVACHAPDYRRWLNLRTYLGQMCSTPLQTKRGCPHRCIYCTYSLAEGACHRLAEPEMVVEAVKRLESQGIYDIEIVDNLFNSPYEHALDVCRALIRAKTKARLQTVEMAPANFTDELLDAMEAAGFVAIGITAESASDKMLDNLAKNFTAEQVRQATEIVSRHDIPTLWMFLFGGPGETKETVTETLRFADTFIRPTDVAFFNAGIRVYPKTRLEMVARAEGALELPPDEMLEPVFYFSPDLPADWLHERIMQEVRTHYNYLGPVSINLPMLPLVHRAMHLLGGHPPVWRHVHAVKKLLRFCGREI